MFAGFGTAEDTNAALQEPDRGRRHRPLDRLRHADAVRLRPRRAAGRRRVRHLRRGGLVLADMEILLDGLPLGEITTSMTINSPAAMIWAMYIVAAEKRGVPRAQLTGHAPERHPQGVHRPEGVHLPAGPVAEAGDRHGRVRARARCRAGTRSASAATTSARRARPRSRSWPSRSPTGSSTSRTPSPAACASTTSRRGSPSSSTATTTSSRRSPSSAPRAGSGTSCAASASGPRTSARPGCASTPRPPACRSPRSSRSNNLTRVAIQALAGVLGGTQSLHTDAYDEAWAVPSEEAALLALRQQQILAEESGVANTVDPLGGSYFVETLTNQTEQAAWALHRRRSTRWAACWRPSRPASRRREIADAAYAQARGWRRTSARSSGVTEFADPNEELRIPLLEISRGAGASPSRSPGARARRARRRGPRARPCSARGGGARGRRRTSCPPSSTRVEAYATIGEMCSLLRAVYGEYREPLAV